MFKSRSSQKELMDDLSLHVKALHDNLRDIENTNRWFGSQRTLISALDILYQHYPKDFTARKMVIADVGCGSGDLLRAISTWSMKKNIKVELLGLEANQFIFKDAVMKSQAYKNILYQSLDVLSAEFKQCEFDIVVLNSFCHHLDDKTLVTFLQQLKAQTKLGIIINDLHRHWLSYYSIKVISRCLKFCYISQHDGPLSVLRAFKREELLMILKQAMIPHFLIRRSRVFRWKVIIWCKP